MFDKLRVRTCWPWRWVCSVSRAAAECCAFLRRLDPQITHLLIQHGRGALLQSSSKLSPRGEAPLCNNEFGIQLTKAHLDLWYCRTAREGSYYGVLYNCVLVQHAKLYACARHSFVFPNTFKLFFFPNFFSAVISSSAFVVSTPLLALSVLFLFAFSLEPLIKLLRQAFPSLSVSGEMYWHSKPRSVISIIYTATVLCH